MDVSQLRNLGFPGVDNDQCRPFGFGPEHTVGNEGVRLRSGIGTDRKDTIRILDFRNGISHGATTECRGKTCHCGRVSEPGAVIHIIGSESGPANLLQKVVFLIAAAGRTQKCEAVSTMLFSNGG